MKNKRIKISKKWKYLKNGLFVDLCLLRLFPLKYFTFFFNTPYIQIYTYNIFKYIYIFKHTQTVLKMWSIYMFSLTYWRLFWCISLCNIFRVNLNVFYCSPSTVLEQIGCDRVAREPRMRARPVRLAPLGSTQRRRAVARGRPWVTSVWRRR